jgi:hypothetical protein
MYNAACLFAVAMACPHLSGEQRELSDGEPGITWGTRSFSAVTMARPGRR